ncbi:MAG: Zn-ribbon domain-containing OB-fold protein [Chloroflexi bacterium]|nr:Zn-ribbon domain-containing OB-fold protein [Chloroflexota bacterium]
MGFEKFGIISFTKEAKPVDFVTYLEQGKVMGSRCVKCGEVHFPPKMDCPCCIDSPVEWVEVKSKGKLLTYAVVNYGPAGFENDAPYTLALAEFDEGIKIFSRLSKDVKEADIKVGMEVKVVPLNLPGDRISYEFQKA